MAGEHDDAISRLDDLIDTVHVNLICYVVQAYMHFLLGNERMESGDYISAIQLFERARAQTRHHTSRALSVISLISGWMFDDLDITVQQRLCEALYAAGHINEAGESLLNIVNTVDEDVCMTEPIVSWVSDFSQRCLSVCKNSLQKKSLSPFPTPLLREWAKFRLIGSSWRHSLAAARDFTVPRFTIYCVLCDHLETTNRMTDAIECFRKMNNELMAQRHTPDHRAKWAIDFTQRCAEKLERLGDIAAEAQQYDEAITHYSTTLSLNPVTRQEIFTKRSEAYVAKGSWGDAVKDTNQVIKLDPSSPWGHERKHAALHAAGRYDDAISAFETMLLKMSQSPDPTIRERRFQYVNPEQTKAAIRGSIENAIREFPLALINTDSGRLLDKSGQTRSFESQPIFRELISSMTTYIDHARIEREVAAYYRYATFSHKWEDDEPLFEKVIRIVVHDLEESPTHDKLQMFCKIVRDSGFHWAWSDTCCINKAHHFVLQEALVSMFKWYEGSAVTIVLLRGVHCPSKCGDLVRSMWNTRAWTLQEYHASKVVRFYTEDWKPYLNLDVPNHKESPEIISEMEEATGVSARALMALRPGLANIREKLRLASTRQTTRVEDAAYSLLGIFSMSLGIVYGEGDKALGRFLAQLLASSGDTSILAWTGRSGSFNSCLPSKIIAFNQCPTTHIPPPLQRAEMDKVIASLRSSSLNSPSIMRLYDRLQELPVPLFVGQRMKLPCIMFKLGPVSASRSTAGHVFRAQTSLLGVVEMTAEEDLTRFGSLYLVHPWIDFLLDRQPVGSVVETNPAEKPDYRPSTIGELASFPGPSNITSTAPQTRAVGVVAPLGRPLGGQPARFPQGRSSSEKPPSFSDSLQPPSSLSSAEMQRQALQVVARLGQPFGALLFTPDLSNVAAYRRVAAESLITVQVVEEVTSTMLDKLVNSVRTLDVL
ncbi:TPR-like protein [Imleria badia]|nr:TPR-like protein [Imleria badia]